MNNGISPDAGRIRPVVLIGADGFIGSTVQTHLQQAGWNVIPTVYRNSPKDKEIFLDVTRPEGFRPLVEVLDGQEFSLVNASGLPDQKSPVKLMRAVHVRGMKNIAAWAEEQGCRHLVQFSSISVYGNATVGTGRTEADTGRPLWNPLLSPLPYGRTKARAETVLEKSRLNWTALRLPAVLGPGDSFVTSEVHSLLSSPTGSLPAGAGKPVSIISDRCIASLVDRILVHGALNAPRNAVQAHPPWRDILTAYAESWGLDPVFSGKPRLSDYLDFSNPGTQMMAYYSTFGAEFPDSLLRQETGWDPVEDWRDDVRAAADALVGKTG